MCFIALFCFPPACFLLAEKQPAATKAETRRTNAQQS